MKSFEQQYSFMPKELTADAGYGSEKNYEYLTENKVEAYVKYNYFDKEQREKEKAKPIFHVDNLFYNKPTNCYYCPMGQKMNFIGSWIEKQRLVMKRLFHAIRHKTVMLVLFVVLVIRAMRTGQ
jgi:hypothetical protein